jgi:hypothetical protein
LLDDLDLLTMKGVYNGGARSYYTPSKSYYTTSGGRSYYVPSKSYYTPPSSYRPTSSYTKTYTYTSSNRGYYNTRYRYSNAYIYIAPSPIIVHPAYYPTGYVAARQRTVLPAIILVMVLTSPMAMCVVQMSLQQLVLLVTLKVSIHLSPQAIFLKQWLITLQVI